MDKVKPSKPMLLDATRVKQEIIDYLDGGVPVPDFAKPVAEKIRYNKEQLRYALGKHPDYVNPLLVECEKKDVIYKKTFDYGDDKKFPQVPRYDLTPLGKSYLKYIKKQFTDIEKDHLVTLLEVTRDIQDIDIHRKKDYNKV
jgi:hypothetical protein